LIFAPSEWPTNPGYTDTNTIIHDTHTSPKRGF